MDRIAIVRLLIGGILHRLRLSPRLQLQAARSTTSLVSADFFSTGREEIRLPLVRIRGPKWPVPGDWWMVHEGGRIATIVLDEAPADMHALADRFQRFEGAWMSPLWIIVLPAAVRRSVYASTLGRMHRTLQDGGRLEGWPHLPLVLEERYASVLEDLRRKLGAISFVPA